MPLQAWGSRLHHCIEMSYCVQSVDEQYPSVNKDLDLASVRLHSRLIHLGAVVPLQHSACFNAYKHIGTSKSARVILGCPGYQGNAPVASVFIV
jgi:hypothetical protein